MEEIGRFVDRKPSKISQFYQLSFQRFDSTEFFQGFVKRDQFLPWTFHDRRHFGQIDPTSTAAVLDATLLTGVLDENPANRFRGSCEEMTSRIPLLGLLNIDKPQISLVYQPRRLERLARLLISKLGGDLL